MIRAELLKMRSSRVPWTLYLVLVAACAVVVIVLAKPAGRDAIPDTYLSAMIGGQFTVGTLLVISLGAWFGGVEFGGGLWQIIVARDSRRGRHVLAKYLTFLIVVVVVSSAIFWTGLGAVDLAARVHHVTPNFADAAGAYGYVLISQLAYGVLALSLALIARSIPLSIVVTLIYYVANLVFGAMLKDAQPFLLQPALERVGVDLMHGASNAAGSALAVSTANAWATIAVYVVVIVGLAFVSFARRDVAER